MLEKVGHRIFEKNCFLVSVFVASNMLISSSKLTAIIYFFPNFQHGTVWISKILPDSLIFVTTPLL